QVSPNEVKKSHKEFLLDEQLQKQVQNIFGNNMLEYTVNLCQGRYDFLVRMPENVIIHILSFLDADDFRQLSKTCKKYQYLSSFKFTVRNNVRWNFSILFSRATNTSVVTRDRNYLYETLTYKKSLLYNRFF
uniref:F-box domain-containing protein n=1 Tax=Apteryx owenii TaxID=8824 RepID=A0A8B9SD97_APTOW